MLAVVVVDFGNETSRDQPKQESDPVEDETDRSFYSRMCQIFLTFLTRVVLVAVADLLSADTSIVAAGTASLVIIVGDFSNLGSDKLRSVIIMV